MTSGAKQVTPSKARQTALSWLLTNLLVLPGMGSIMGGRKIGYLQAAMAISGMVLSLVFAVSIVREWWVLRELPELDRRWLVQGVGGILLFGCGWLWGLMTGLNLVRRAEKTHSI
jgi:hypothetical protein